VVGQVGPVEVGPDGTLDQVEQRPEHDVLVVVDNLAHLVGDGVVGATLRGLPIADLRVEARLEVAPQGGHHLGGPEQDLLDARQRVPQPELPTVAVVGADHVDGSPGDGGAQQDAVHHVVGHPVLEDRFEALHQEVAPREDGVALDTPHALQPEGVDVEGAVAARDLHRHST